MDFRPPKGKMSRYVPCNPVLRAELKSLVERERIGLDEPFFRNATGKPIDHDNFVDRYFERDIREAYVKKIRFHDMSHTGTTLMVADCLDFKTVRLSVIMRGMDGF